MSEDELRWQVERAAERHGVPGVAAAVWNRGGQFNALYGVTSIENPLEVNADTLFQVGSIAKTFTATAIMRLVEAGLMDLDAPVRRYVPELRLQDPATAERVTVRHLLNHTAGWAGDLFVDTGQGDDALARYVKEMASIEQEAPLGSLVSYNNASFSLAGRAVEKVTGMTFESAMHKLVLTPLGLKHCLYFASDIMTRRFAVGHRQRPEGSLCLARPWALPRAIAPAGGISAKLDDLVAWARFHMGDGKASDGTGILAAPLLHRMQEPTADARGSALGHWVGISWLLRDVEGVRLVGHDGGTNGQLASLLMVPERNWALAILTNGAPGGSPLIREVQRWALQASLGVVDREPEPVAAETTRLQALVGEYRSLGYLCRVAADDEHLTFTVRQTPAVAREASDEAFDEPPSFSAGLLPGDGDRYIIMDGHAKGRLGYFGRTAQGSISGLHLFGRWLRRTP
jgi:CubicO group peptidase (beta-lactamase class C family)